MKLPVLPTLAAAFLLLGSPHLCADDEDEKTEEKDPKGIRTFTSKNGKTTIKARVLTRLDDERYKVESAEGKVFTLNIQNLSRSDQLFLEFWEPDAILDLAAAPLNEVMEKMEYSTAKLTATGGSFFVTLNINGTTGKFILDPGRQWSVLNPTFAKKLNVEMGQGRVNVNGGRSQACTPDTLTLGDVELKSPRFEVYDLSATYRSLPAGTGGSLGGDLLPQLNAVVDYGGRQLFVRSKKK